MTAGSGQGILARRMREMFETNDVTAYSGDFDRLAFGKDC